MKQKRAQCETEKANEDILNNDIYEWKNMQEFENESHQTQQRFIMK